MAKFADELSHLEVTLHSKAVSNKPVDRIVMIEHHVRFGADPIENTEMGHVTLSFSVMAPDTIDEWNLSDYLENQGLKMLSILFSPKILDVTWFLEDFDCE